MLWGSQVSNIGPVRIRSLFPSMTIVTCPMSGSETIMWNVEWDTKMVWRRGRLDELGTVTVAVLTTDIAIKASQGALQHPQTQSPNCRAVRRRSMHSLPTDRESERGEKLKGERRKNANVPLDGWFIRRGPEQRPISGRCEVRLTLADAEDVSLLRQQQGQALHQQQGLVVAEDRRLPLVEHFVQCSCLDLEETKQEEIRGNTRDKHEGRDQMND